MGGLFVNQELRGNHYKESNLESNGDTDCSQRRVAIEEVRGGGEGVFYVGKLGLPPIQKSALATPF